MLTNYHCHSGLCDGVMEPRDYVVKALELGMNSLGFSGHAPLPFENNWTMTEEGLKEYISVIRELQEEYRGKIDLFLGLEIDYVPKVTSPAEERWQDLPLDYTIGSVHYFTLDGREKKYAVDYTLEQFVNARDQLFGGDIRALTGNYYSSLKKMIELGGFNILGHMDLVKLHNKNGIFFSEEDQWYRDQVEGVLDELQKTDIIIEINTGGISRGKTADFYPSRWILKQCRAKNIPIMINSDSHKPEQLTNMFTEAAELARSVGYTEKKILTSRGFCDTAL